MPGVEVSTQTNLRMLDEIQKMKASIFGQGFDLDDFELGVGSEDLSSKLTKLDHKSIVKVHSYLSLLSSPKFNSLILSQSKLHELINPIFYEKKLLSHSLDDGLGDKFFPKPKGVPKPSFDPTKNKPPKSGDLKRAVL